MVENIHYYDNKDQDCFDDLTLANPTRLQGGAYFSKLSYNEEPFLFQTPKSFTKKGVIFTNKKAYCDLLFTTDNYKFVEWIESLSKAIQFLIYEKKDLWFNNDMELEDIEYFFNPSLRLFRKDKYLLRCYIQQPKYIKKPFSLQIYDENENDLTINDLNSDQKLISILEVLGIKFTSSSFHIEFCLRQIMIINEKPLFQKCLIKRKNNIKENTVIKEEASNCGEGLKEKSVSEKSVSEENVRLIIDEKVKENDESVGSIEPISNDNNVVEEVSKEVVCDVQNIKEKGNLEVEKEIAKEEVVEEIKKKEEVPIKLGDSEEQIVENILPKFKETLTIEHLEKNGDIKEIDLDIMDNDEPIVLKKPNEVYLEIYKKARRKAKEAKKLAIKAFLEAKRIKNTYLLDNIEDDSDSLSDLSDLSDFNDYEETEQEKVLG